MSFIKQVSCLKCSLLALFLLFFQLGFAQYDFGPLNNEIEKNRALLGKDLVVMIYKDDSLVYKKEIGDFNATTQAPIASCSKWLTAALVMIFADEGKLSLDDKVAKYLPEFDKYFKGYITIRQCLSHMTRIEDEGVTIRRLLQRRKFSSLEEEVNSFAAREIRANPGTDFWYGNVGLNIAGRVLEVISKKKFDVLIRQKLFTPLGMTKTSFNSPNSPVNPSGGAKSTADDYMKFLIMLLTNGKYNGKQILSEKSINEMRKIQNKTSEIKYAPKSAEGYRYALGSWVVEEKTNSSPVGDSQREGAKLGEGAALASPGLFGTWPMIDYCRGYAYIVFVKNFLGEERADVHKELKKIIDKQIPSGCK